MGLQKRLWKKLQDMRLLFLTLIPTQSQSLEVKQQQSETHEAVVVMRPLGQAQRQQQHRPLIQQVLHSIRQARLMMRLKWQSKQ